jgi:hypothetical protein
MSEPFNIAGFCRHWKDPIGHSLSPHINDLLQHRR